MIEDQTQAPLHYICHMHLLVIQSREVPVPPQPMCHVHNAAFASLLLLGLLLKCSRMLWAPATNQALRLDSTALLLIAVTRDKGGGTAPPVAGDMFCCFMTLLPQLLLVIFCHSLLPSSAVLSFLFSFLFPSSLSLNHTALNNSRCIQ